MIRAAAQLAAHIVDRTLTALWPARHIHVPLELASTAVSTTTGCATTGSAGHPTT